MTALEAAIAEAASTPGALGAVLCDFEGETVVARLGEAEIPPAVAEEARRHVPEGLRATVRSGEFLLRLAGAEPCALLALFARRSEEAGVGPLEALEIGYAAVGLLAMRLPDDYYLVIVLDRTKAAGFARARRMARRLQPVLSAEIG